MAKKATTPKAPKAPKEAVEHRHISELSNKDREALEAILRKEAGTLTDVELATLEARKAYLTTDEIAKYDL